MPKLLRKVGHFQIIAGISSRAMRAGVPSSALLIRTKDPLLAKSNVEVYVWEEDVAGKPVYWAAVFEGRSRKPRVFDAYISPQERESAVKTSLSRLTNYVKVMLERRKERSQPTSLQKGDFLYTSGGYNQTNVAFYQVVGLTKSGKSIRVRQVAKNFVNKDMTRVVPVPGKFLGKMITVRSSGDGATIDGEFASKFEGRPVYQTSPYAPGH